MALIRRAVVDSDLVGCDLLKHHEELYRVGILGHLELILTRYGMLCDILRVYSAFAIGVLIGDVAELVAYSGIRNDDDIVADAGVDIPGLVFLVVDSVAEDRVAVASVGLGNRFTAIVNDVACAVYDELCVLVEVDAHSDVAVRHDEGVPVERVGAAVSIGDDDIAGGHSFSDARDIDLELNACAAAGDLLTVDDGGNIEPAVAAVGGIKHNIVIDVELDADGYGEVRHGEGHLVLVERDRDAAVAGHGYIGDVIVERLGGASLDLDGLADLCALYFLAVNRSLEGTLGVVDLLYCEGGLCSRLHDCDNRDGLIRHYEAHLVELSRLGEVRIVDLDRLDGVIRVGSYLKSNGLTGLCGGDDSAADLCGDLGVADIGIDVAAHAGLIIGIDLEGCGHGHREVRHCELAVLDCDRIAVVIICNSYIVEHEAGSGSGLDNDLSAGISLVDTHIVDHRRNAAVGGRVNGDSGLHSLLEGHADGDGVRGHDKAVVGDGDCGSCIADLDDLDGFDCIAGIRGADDADELTGGSGLDALAVHLQVEVAVGGILADKVVVAGVADRTGRSGAAGRAAADGGVGRNDARNRDIQRLTHAEQTHVASVVEGLQLCEVAVVIQTVAADDDVVRALTGFHGVRHDGGVGRAGNTGRNDGQDQRLTGLYRVDVSEVVELDYLILIGLVAQTHVGVDAADGLALLDGICDQIVGDMIAGRQIAHGAGGETGAGGCTCGVVAGAGDCGSTACKSRRCRIGYGQDDLCSDRELSELALIGHTVEGHDQIFIGIIVYTVLLADAENCVSAADRHGCDLRVGGCGNRKHRAQRYQHDERQQETDEPLFHRICSP